VRRLEVLVLASAVAAATTLAVAATPAGAHICPIPVTMNVGQSSTIDIGVTVETTPVPDVEITVPAGLRLDGFDPTAGWTITRRGATLRYRGGPIPAYGCKYFSIRVTPPTRGSFGIPVTERAADGRIVARTSPDPSNTADRLLDQMVYAGVDPPKTAGGSGGPSTTTIVGIALAVLGAVLGTALAVRARRARRDDEDTGDDSGGASDGTGPSERDTELRARLEQFRSQTPDGSAP